MIVIIGGGPAGRISAMRLARAKKEVTLVEKNKIGGQCLHHG
jgi:dihydrolipoamide dehydrogenase